MLTQEQIAHYDTFGFLVLKGLFSADEIDEFRSVSLSVMSDLRGGCDYIKTHNQAVQPWFERHPSMENLVDDDRLHQIGASLCGPDFWLDGTEGQLRVGDTAWHADTATPEDLPWVKLAIYLDPLTKDDGCLRVIPGTHRERDPDPYAGLRKGGPNADPRPFGVRPDEIPAVALETEPGDVLVFTERVIHGAFGGGVGRHQICVSFVGDLKTDQHVDYVRQFYEQAKWSASPTRTYVDSDRPRIRRMVGTPLKLGFEILEV